MVKNFLKNCLATVPKRWTLTRRYEKPTKHRQRVNFERCQAIYNEDMQNRIQFIMKKNRKNPYPAVWTKSLKLVKYIQTRKYLLRGYLLGLLTHITAWLQANLTKFWVWPFEILQVTLLIREFNQNAFLSPLKYMWQIGLAPFCDVLKDHWKKSYTDSIVSEHVICKI